MHECQMYVTPPFSLAQIKSINLFQRMSEFFSRLKCKCGGEYFAAEYGLVCRKCTSCYDNEVPMFIANNAWNQFRTPLPPEEEEIEDGID